MGASSEPRRVLVGGLEVRPLFLYRWLQGQETQRAWLDLAIDSLGLELGAIATQPAGTSFARRRRAAGGARGRDADPARTRRGPWVGLHGGVRWSEAALRAGPSSGSDDRSAYVSITLAWHQVVVAHVVDVGDEAPR